MSIQIIIIIIDTQISKIKECNFLYFINNKQSIISSLNNFIGPRYFPPKWSLGFQFSSMEIADDENSQKLYLEFLNKCKELKIPLSSFALWFWIYFAW